MTTAAPGQSQPSSVATLVRVPFDDLPFWAEDDHLAALRALAKCRAGDAMPQRDAVETTLAEICARAGSLLATDPDQSRARRFFETEFEAHSVEHAGPPGLLTGYFEPVLEGSLKPTDKFRVAIYRRPPDLINLVDEADRAAAGAALTHARRTAAGTEPYDTRADIERGSLSGRGLEIAYVEDPVDAFFMQVQGSGRIRLQDGTELRLGYDGKNGHPYTSVGRHLIDRGEITAEAMSLDTLAAWLRADPERGRVAMQINRSFVFFRPMPSGGAEGPVGVRSIPLTAGRSLAVDASIHAIGLPIYVSAPELGHVPASLGGRPEGFHRLLIAQDVGSAIRGPERGDIFFGTGAQAGHLAGITKHPGRFFVLRPRIGPQ